MPYSDPRARAYHTQVKHAQRRRISWQLTFDQWCVWWQAKLGPNWLRKRGRGKGLYCMARFNDTGPYSIENIKCVLFEENIIESALRRTGAKNPFFGKRHTDATKLKISMSKTGRPNWKRVWAAQRKAAP